MSLYMTILSATYLIVNAAAAVAACVPRQYNTCFQRILSQTPSCCRAVVVCYRTLPLLEYPGCLIYIHILCNSPRIGHWNHALPQRSWLYGLHRWLIVLVSISSHLRISTWSKEDLLQSAAATRCWAAGDWWPSCIPVAVCPFYRRRRRTRSHCAWWLPAPSRRQTPNSWPTSPGTATSTKTRKKKKAKSWRASAGWSDRVTPRRATV